MDGYRRRATKTTHKVQNSPCRRKLSRPVARQPNQPSASRRSQSQSSFLKPIVSSESSSISVLRTAGSTGGSGKWDLFWCRHVSSSGFVVIRTGRSWATHCVKPRRMENGNPKSASMAGEWPLAQQNERVREEKFFFDDRNHEATGPNIFSPKETAHRPKYLLPERGQDVVLV
jgi:hypothetical protein